MNKLFSDESWNDYLYWQKTDKKVIKRINELIKDISRTPFLGLGKPEALKFNLSGYWSRRIDGEHRLIYKIENNCIIILSCRYHYE
ncbi:MAG: Txe/YoeB family addiction module toxin [Gilliamella sp.]|uniref:Txe/YoeB family addiction module toxin n=1 Tax=unclassified Gilliamella TaxID=2685620 RepID=UPI00080E5EB5|nr:MULTISPECIES: Txe/YoeB family addiction module toxin [Gilliamella]MCO6551357.1 Txe/YoeB family addiction module toxin [Gilliamella sp.]MCO6560504.1 Txe/YoeB family addiction module toxin [Gilliamella sp.]OCG33701.1 toxin YoeB [Gilliamella apicola]OCG35472.1 toxin YoeB [Gilliamella apicola]OCG50391.1 toxin YoeB [Gilliamella apicola]